MLADYTVIKNHIHRCLTKHTPRKASRMSVVPTRCQASVGVICNGQRGSSHHNEMDNVKGKPSFRRYSNLVTSQPTQPHSHVFPAVLGDQRLGWQSTYFSSTIFQLRLDAHSPGGQLFFPPKQSPRGKASPEGVLGDSRLCLLLQWKFSIVWWSLVYVRMGFLTSRVPGSLFFQALTFL